MFEFHVMSANSLNGVQVELEKRDRDGWELLAAYPEMKGGSTTKHVLIFRKAVST